MKSSVELNDNTLINGQKWLHAKSEFMKPGALTENVAFKYLDNAAKKVVVKLVRWEHNKMQSPGSISTKTFTVSEESDALDKQIYQTRSVKLRSLEAKVK